MTATDTTSDDELRATFQEIEHDDTTWAKIADPLNEDAWIKSTCFQALEP